jgi:hypothetical protein
MRVIGTVAVLLGIGLLTGACTRNARLVHLASGQVLEGEVRKGAAGTCDMEFRGTQGERLEGECTLAGPASRLTGSLGSTNGRLPTPSVRASFDPLRGTVRLTGGARLLNCAFVVERPSWHGDGTCRDGNGDSYRLSF